jgi:hypothetical protein
MHGMFKGKVRSTGQFYSHFDSADINQAEYTEMKAKPTDYIKDQTLSLWGCWLLRNPDSDYSKNVAIILPIIFKLVFDLIALLKDP